MPPRPAGNRRKRKENGKKKEKKEKKTVSPRKDREKGKKEKRQQDSWAKGKIHGSGKRKTNYIRGNVAGTWENGESGVFYPYFRH